VCVQIINPGRVRETPLRIFVCVCVCVCVCVLVCVWFPSFFRGGGDGFGERFKGLKGLWGERERGRALGGVVTVLGLVVVEGWRGGVFGTWDLGG